MSDYNERKSRTTALPKSQIVEYMVTIELESFAAFEVTGVDRNGGGCIQLLALCQTKWVGDWSELQLRSNGRGATH